MIRKWLHNKRFKTQPMCICGWRMIPSIREHFESYWECKYHKCNWEAFTSTSGRMKWWKS